VAEFVKLYGSILDSTVWLEALPTKVVWITMLAMADWKGKVSAAIPTLAKRAGVTRNECEAALSVLSAPDPDSKTKDHEGRRIQEVEGGWVILNHQKYRDARSERQVKTAERVAKHRQKRKKALPVTDVTRGNGVKRSVRTDADTDTERSTTPADAGSVTGNGQKTWPVEGSELWTEQVGHITAPRFGKAIKPVVTQHGWPQTKAALLTYIELNEGKTRKVEWFAADSVRWVNLANMPCVDPNTRELTEKGRMAYNA